MYENVSPCQRSALCNLASTCAAQADQYCKPWPTRASCSPSLCSISFICRHLWLPTWTAFSMGIVFQCHSPLSLSCSHHPFCHSPDFTHPSVCHAFLSCTFESAERLAALTLREAAPRLSCKSGVHAPSLELAMAEEAHGLNTNDFDARMQLKQHQEITMPQCQNRQCPNAPMHSPSLPNTTHKLLFTPSADLLAEPNPYS